MAKLRRTAHKKGIAAGESLKASPAAPSSMTKYDVYLTDTAEAVYTEMHRRSKEAEMRGDTTNAHCTTFRQVQDAIKNIIPSDPINRRYALSGELSNIFRLKKGRMRICWVASSKQHKVVILFISDTPRKQGDINDPYRIFAQMVMSGDFDEVFGELGIRIPPRQQPEERVRTH